MYRTILTLASLLASTAAYAQSAPRPIAYATASSRGDTIYLVNPDGSGLTKLYSGKAPSRFGSPIEDIALRMESGGGGEVAFIENRVLKIQNHAGNGQPIGAAYAVNIPDATGCIPFDIDYRADGTLLAATSCGNVWTVAPNEIAAASQPLFGSAGINAIAAIGNSLLYVFDNTLKFRDDAGSTTTLPPTLSNPYLHLDATSGTAYLSDKMTFQTVGLTSPYQAAVGCTQGGYVAISPSGSEMIYLYRNQLLLHNSNCGGRTPSRLARGVRSFAWRAN